MIFDQLDFKEEKVMDNEKIEKLQQMIDESDHMAQVFQQRVIFQTFEARMVCITRLINIHPRLW
jgi:hypothetical protein